MVVAFLGLLLAEVGLAFDLGAGISSSSESSMTIGSALVAVAERRVVDKEEPSVLEAKYLDVGSDFFDAGDAGDAAAAVLRVLERASWEDAGLEPAAPPPLAPPPKKVDNEA